MPTPTHRQIWNIYYTTKSIPETIEVVQEIFEVTITEADIVTAIRSGLADEFNQYPNPSWNFKPGLGRRVRYIS